MPLSLILRLVKGFKLTPAEMDNNLLQIQNAVNGFQSQLAAALNPDGTLKNDSVSTNAIQDRAVTLRKLAFLSQFWALDTGAANALVITFTPALPALSAGLVFYVQALASNSGASTLQVDATAAVAIKKYTSAGIVDVGVGDIIAGGQYIFVHDGVRYVLLNATPPLAATSGPVFLPVLVTVYGPAGNVTWSDFDASGSIPVGAKAAILQGRGDWNTSTDGTILTQIRPDAGGPTLTLNEVGATDAASSTTQGVFPITAARHFQYQVSTSVLGTTSTIKLIGYIT